MTEQERKIVVERIKDDLAKTKLRQEKIELKNKLEQDDKVKEYLRTLKEIKYLNSRLKRLNSKDAMIKLEFIWAFYSRIKSGGILPCNHDIWIYCGSYGFWEDPRWEHDHEYLVIDEDYENFNYNKYSCLECGKLIKIEDYKDFEENNLVLKNRRDLDAEKYISLYYQLLYKHSVEQSRKMVTLEFNKNKSLTRKK